MKRRDFLKKGGIVVAGMPVLINHNLIGKVLGKDRTIENIIFNIQNKSKTKTGRATLYIPSFLTPDNLIPRQMLELESFPEIKRNLIPIKLKGFNFATNNIGNFKQSFKFKKYKDAPNTFPIYLADEYMEIKTNQRIDVILNHELYININVIPNSFIKFELMFSQKN